MDRIRNEGAVTHSSLSWTTRAGVGGVAISAVSLALFLSAPAAFADAQPTGTTTVATTGQVAPSTGGTTSTTTSMLDTGTPVSTQSTSPSGVTPVGTDASPSNATGGASANSGTGGNGTPNAIVTTAGGPSSGSSSTAPGPPGSTSTPTSTVGTDASPSNATGGANANSGTGGNGTLTAIVTTAGGPGSSGSSSTATGPPGSTSTHSSTDPTASPDTPSSNIQNAQSNANANQSGAQNGNVSVRVGQGGGTDSVTQGNQASSSACSSATGNLPQTGRNPSAIAAAGTTQDSPNNTNLAVRVASPGDIGGVGQQNNAQAGAAATGTTGSSGTGGGGTAAATATQTSPGNLNVVVRVGSPGDNGAVSQQNTVGASAGPSCTPTPVGSAADSGGPAATDQLVTTANTQTAVTNNGTVNQQLIQTQDGPGPNVVTVGDATLAPTVTSTTGTATATQTGARNINVSIRVGSPGSDRTVTQTNGVTASGTSPALSLVKVTDRSNLNLAIVLPSPATDAPGNQWIWNWAWTGDGTPPTGATAGSAAPTTGSPWNWTWTTPPTGSPTTAGSPTTGTSTANGSSAAASPTPGMFTWTWMWTMADGQAWTLTQQQACDCNWQWNWTWDWSSHTPASTPAETVSPTGSAPSTGSDPTVAPAAAPSLTYNQGPVSQSNTVTATATASADVTVARLLSVSQTGVDPALEMQVAENGQLFTNNQTVTAVSQADQLHPSNINSVWGVPVASVTQSNVVSAASLATASANLDQELIQGQNGTDGTYQWEGAQQTTENVQDIRAGTQAAQIGAGNANLVSAPHANQAAVGSVEQSNSATTSAAAAAQASLVQQLAQFEEAIGAGVELIDITQLIASTQTAIIASTVGQARTQNINNLVVPAASRATNPTVRQRNIVATNTTSENMGDLTSVAFQYQGGVADIELTSAIQQIGLTQSALAYAPANQADLLNYAGWLGVEPPAPPAPGGGGDGTNQLGVNDSSGSDALTVSSPTAVGGPTTLTDRYTPFSTGVIPYVVQAGSTHQQTRASTGNAAQIHPPAVGWAIAGGQNSVAQSTVPKVSQVLAAAVTRLGTSPTPGQLDLDSGNAKSPARVSPAPESAGAPAQSETPWVPGFPGNPGSAGTGTSGSAPSTGGGQTVLAFGPQKFAAPEVLGPQMLSPVLGRSVAFLDPFERPG